MQFILYASKRLACLDYHYDSVTPLCKFPTIFTTYPVKFTLLSCCSVLFCPTHLCGLLFLKKTLLSHWLCHYPHFCNFALQLALHMKYLFLPSSLGKLFLTLQLRTEKPLPFLFIDLYFFWIFRAYDLYFPRGINDQISWVPFFVFLLRAWGPKRLDAGPSPFL